MDADREVLHGGGGEDGTDRQPPRERREPGGLHVATAERHLQGSELCGEQRLGRSLSLYAGASTARYQMISRVSCGTEANYKQMVKSAGSAEEVDEYLSRTGFGHRRDVFRSQIG